MPGAKDLLRRVAEMQARAAAEGDSFNPAALIAHRELNLSFLLGWLLNPSGTHGVGTKGLELFLELLGIKRVDASQCVVELEVPRFADGELRGRIDIQVEHPDFTVLIENKPTAAFGDQQLARYASTLVGRRHDKVVALVGRGWLESNIATIRQEGHADVLQLGMHVREWVRSCSAVAKQGPVQDFIEALGTYLENTHGIGGSKVTNDIVSSIAAAPETVAAAIGIIEAYDALAEQICRQFSATVERRAIEAGLRGLRHVAGEPALFGSRSRGTLRIDIGIADADATIESDGTYFDDIFISLCLRKSTTGIKTKYSEQIFRLAGALGNAEDAKDEGWYLWWNWLSSLDTSGRSATRPSLWAWAADDGDEGLAALFVSKAVEMKRALTVAS